MKNENVQKSRFKDVWYLNGYFDIVTLYVITL